MSKKKPISVSSFISQELVERKIYSIRGKKVMLDKELSDLYGVETKAMNRAVRRNLDRFPEDFMFQLTPDEIKNLRCQFGTSSWGGRRYTPYAFTEHGILMLSSVLNSKQAIQVNIQIMRTFTKLRELMNSHKDLRLRIDELEKKYDNQFQVVFKAIELLLNDKQKGNDNPRRF